MRNTARVSGRIRGQGYADRLPECDRIISDIGSRGGESCRKGRTDIPGVESTQSAGAVRYASHLLLNSQRTKVVSSLVGGSCANRTRGT